MCYPTDSAYKLIWFFKVSEIFFLVWAFLVCLCLLFSKSVFEMKLRWLNDMIRMHRLSGTISGTPEGLLQFRRHLKLLLALLIMVITLIWAL